MTGYVSKFTLVALLIVTAAGAAAAQNAAPVKPLVPLKVQVVISRYDGDKKVSSLPYSLSVTANGDRVSLKMGSQIPMPSFAPNTVLNQPPVQSYQYMNVGTNIDSSATTTDDGRFRVFVGVQDSSVMDRGNRGGVPTLQNFSIESSVTLRDGQTSQFTSAADKTTGEVVRVDVTVNVER